MPTVYEVPTPDLIDRLAKHLKQNMGEISPPPWSEYAKTGPQKERPPQNPDWWYYRCASLLRKIYIHGPVGVSRLRTEYGGLRRTGNRPEKHVRSGGSAIREPLQQLQKADLVAVDGKKGRRLTKQGVSLLNSTAAGILKDSRSRRASVPSQSSSAPAAPAS